MAGCDIDRDFAVQFVQKATEPPFGEQVIFAPHQVGDFGLFDRQELPNLPLFQATLLEELANRRAELRAGQ